MPASGSYRVLLLDLDGTAVDYARTERAALAVIHQEFCPASLRLADFTRAFHARNRQLWAAYRRTRISLDELRARRFAGLPGCRPQQAAAAAARFELELGARAELYPDSLPALRALHRAARLVLVTDGIAAVQRAKLTRTGLHGLFEHVVISAEVGCCKPDPGPLRHALARAGAARGAALMVGDSPATDGAAAAAAGVDFCWVDRRGRTAARAAARGPGQPPGRVSPRLRVPDLAALAGQLTAGAVRPARPGPAALPAVPGGAAHSVVGVPR